MSLLRLTAIALLALPVFAQTTGGLVGRVTQAGSMLPGVTVEARSPALQGVRTAVTTSDGTYRLPLLPPGEYTLTVSLAGFRTETRRVVVSLGKESSADVAMSAQISETINVVNLVPVVDPGSTALGTSVNAGMIESLPTGRNYASVVQIVPGVSSDANAQNPGQSTITVYGSSGAENSFLIDGVNTTGVEYGFQGKELNFEFIQEVDVKTGGYEAEYGRSTGGIINVITKSGSNEFSGDVFGYYDSDSLRADASSVVSVAGTPEGFRRDDFGVDIGGPIVRDKLWFFAAYDRAHNALDSSLPEGPQAGELVTSNSRRNLGSAKLTYALAPNHTLVGTYLQDPRVDSGAINDANHFLNGDPATYLGRQDFGGRDYALRYDGILSSQWIMTAQAARHRESNSVGPASSAGDVIQYRDAAHDFYQTGGFGLIQTKRFDRKHYGGALATYVSDHSIKGGLEYEIADANVMKRMSGGQQVDVIENKSNPARPIYRHFYWTTPTATLANAPVSALNATPQHKVTTLYLQDRWSMKNNLILNYGVRWDRQQIVDASGVTQIDMKKDFAPRLGFTWDPTGGNHAKFFGSFGRFYEEIPMDLVIRSFSYERQPRIINYSRTSNTPDPSAEAALGTTPSAILGGFTEPSDPNIKNQFLNEYILGYEREVTRDIAVGVKGIYRNYGRVVEDFLCADDGTYCIGNPSEGIMKEVFALDYEHKFAAPKPKRTFKGVQFDATRRRTGNWQAMASYVFSKLDGNYDGEYAPFTNVGADPNISAAYDYYDFFTNGSDLTKITNRGPLSNDRRHQLKTSGTYFSPFNLTVGWSAYWRSGTPVTRYGYSDAYGRYEFFLTERGAEGRTPSNYDADVHLGYPIDVGRGAKVNLILDVFSILNTQRAVLLDQRWGTQETDNSVATPANPGYLKPVLRTPPTSARIGVRVSF